MDYSQHNEFKYHKKDQPIPEGWELAHDLQDCHHGRHAIIIKQIKRLEPYKAKSGEGWIV